MKSLMKQPCYVWGGNEYIGCYYDTKKGIEMCIVSDKIDEEEYKRRANIIIESYFRCGAREVKNES